MMFKDGALAILKLDHSGQNGYNDSMIAFEEGSQESITLKKLPSPTNGYSIYTYPNEKGLVFLSNNPKLKAIQYDMETDKHHVIIGSSIESFLNRQLKEWDYTLPFYHVGKKYDELKISFLIRLKSASLFRFEFAALFHTFFIQMLLMNDGNSKSIFFYRTVCLGLMDFKLAKIFGFQTYL